MSLLHLFLGHWFRGARFTMIEAMWGSFQVWMDVKCWDERLRDSDMRFCKADHGDEDAGLCAESLSQTL